MSQKKIKFGKNGELTVERPKMDEERAEAMFHIMAHIAAIHDAMPQLEGTIYYSTAVVKELDRYADTKLKPIYRQPNSHYIADSTVLATQTFREICKRMYQMSLQPVIVQERFNIAMENLFIQHGVYIPEVQPIKVK